jgi:hypothetical protein
LRCGKSGIREANKEVPGNKGVPGNVDMFPVTFLTSN